MEVPGAHGSRRVEAQALRRFDWPPPILFVSGYGIGPRELQSPVLKKPSPPRALLTAVQDILGTSDQRARG